MASDNAFNKRLTAETTMDKVEGLLEHFNLPPKALSFIRANEKILIITLVVVLVAVVAGSIYRSYRARHLEEASSALAVATRQNGAGQAEALQKVIADYGSTWSAKWAELELAHVDMKNGAYGAAADKYRKVLAEVSESNPLYPLVLFGIAQSLEADKKYDEAIAQYDALKGFKGFEQLAYTSMGRIEEMRGNIDKAIAVYNNFLVSIGDDPSFAQAKEEIDHKVARLKARK